MKAWVGGHTHACTRAWRRLAAQPAGSLLSVLVIGLAISLPLGLYLLFTNISAAASRVNTDPNINVYMALDASETDAQELERRIRASGTAAQIKFVSKEAALADMKRVPALKELMTSLEGNPLPHAFSLRPTVAGPDGLTRLRTALAGLPKVDRVVMDFEWAEKLRRFAIFAERLVLLIGCVLALAVVFVTGNTIRLQILTQREEIEVSRLIGATRSFVRRPFLYFGATQGMLAGTVAVCLVTGLIAWAGNEVLALTVSYGTEFVLHAPTFDVAFAVILLATLLGWLGALLSVGLYVRRAR
jgi:cell division transport system permease protein